MKSKENASPRMDNIVLIVLKELLIILVLHCAQSLGNPLIVGKFQIVGSVQMLVLCLKWDPRMIRETTDLSLSVLCCGPLGS